MNVSTFKFETLRLLPFKFLRKSLNIIYIIELWYFAFIFLYR